MIHLKIKLSPETQAWLDDVVKEKDEKKRLNQERRLMHSILRESTNLWETFWLQLQKDKSIDMNSQTGVTHVELSDVKLATPIDEIGDDFKDKEFDYELVIGTETTTALLHEHFLIGMISPTRKANFNEWLRDSIEAGIMLKKSEDTKARMMKEESELYSDEEKKQ